MKNTYMKATIGLYSNYFLLGMVNIILSSNMASLTEKWDTSSTMISYIIAAIGFGKLLTYSGLGVLSDKIGRKPLLIFSSLFMAVFLISIPLLPNYMLAFIFAILAGVANAAMDAGSYPALVEIFTKSSGSANVLVKAFIATGATILPFIILFLSENELFFGYAFFLLAAFYLLNMMLLLIATFPKVNQVVISESGEQLDLMPKYKTEPKILREGLALIIIGFTSTALFTVAQIWLPSYGQDAVSMTNGQSVKLLSYYSIGSVISVLFLAFILKKRVKPTTILIVYPIITLVIVAIILAFKVPIVVIIASFFLGFSTAGILQLAITLMTEMFWMKKGAVTGLVATASSVASVVMPIVTGMIAKSGAINYIFIFDGFVAVIGILAAIFTYIRYNKLTTNYH
ncbi:MFS transporter [Lysinibacillus sp. SGAir0095]|uniref:MFS transporter n=1 Tax=Lysinibacillus sp. SGAir0095 TaxID=2070463 RepID=UPI0010CD51A5|nr:MFS transporter [Lysinibacillus sp. SGAir0095]QCR33313.1 MFS transporter [Lysinibacillus sp. SGAir0095]